MSKNTLTIYFQRDTNDSSKDDVLKVTSADDGWVLVRYVDKTANIKNMSFMRENGFMAYMESLFTLMQFDSAPYENVQISAPCHPMVLIPTQNLSNDGCMNAIGNVLSSCWRIWYPFSAKTADMEVEEIEVRDIEEDDCCHQFNGCPCEQE